MSFQSELEKLANFDDITFDTQVQTVTGQSAKNVFCKGWPSTKVVLESIAAMVKNPVVKILIGIVIKAGDALSIKICE
jgi:hypothetical protein